VCRGQLKYSGSRAETRFRLSAKRSSPFKLAGASVQSTTGNRGVRISGSNAGYTMFRGSVKSTGYPLHSPISPSLPLPASYININCLVKEIKDRQIVFFHSKIHSRLSKVFRNISLEMPSICALSSYASWGTPGLDHL